MEVMTERGYRGVMIRPACCTVLAGVFVAGCASGRAGRDAGHTGAVRVTVETSAGEIHLELDRSHAPVTVENFLMHARRGDYDGTTFHRVVPGFVIQGGGWTAELVERARLDAEQGRPDSPIVNEWTNGLKNVRGTIAMAREEGPDTATREFFINLSDNARLDTARATTGNAGYAVFGRVVRGMEVVDAIAAVPTSAREVAGVTDGSMGHVPERPVVIRRVRAGAAR